MKKCVIKLMAKGYTKREARKECEKDFKKPVKEKEK